jgi:uncharacterized protein (TIGR00266 family)
MKVEVLYRPSYSLAKLTLNANEGVQAETGAMVGMSAGVEMETKMRGGLLKSLARSVLGGESFFVNMFRASSNGGELLLAPTMPGDVFAMKLTTGQEYLVQSGSFLAASEGVETDTKWTGAKTFFAGEGLIMLRCAGAGDLILSSYGAIHEIDLAAGQVFTVDTTHLVAFPSNVGFRVRTIGGMKSTLLGGEGLVVDLTGPGKILLQTRSIGAFLDWLIPHLPKQSNGS